MIRCWLGKHTYERVIDERGFQYCKFCGVAKHINVKCEHLKLEQLFFYHKKNVFGKVSETRIVLVCESCGDVTSKII